jgi:hypothetical protein
MTAFNRSIANLGSEVHECKARAGILALLLRLAYLPYNISLTPTPLPEGEGLITLSQRERDPMLIPKGGSKSLPRHHEFALRSPFAKDT